MNGQITIYRPDGSELVTITYETGSYRRWQVMGENAVTLKFDYAGFLTIPVGSYVTFKGQRYTLYNPSGFTKDGTRKYEYELKLEAYLATMADTMFINIPDGRTTFSRTARPQEFLQSLVDNLNREDSGWTVGAYIEAAPKNIPFNDTQCDEALRQMAEAFKTEWEVNGKAISLRKVEYFKDAPIKLQYGRGNGLKRGLKRKNYDNHRPVKRMFVTGGERNIDFSTYGSQTLLLPAGQSIAYDGTYFEDQPGFDTNLARTYTVSGDGRSLIRTDVSLRGREAGITLTEICPMREGAVTGVEVTPNTGDGENDYYDFFDNTIPDALDYSKYRMAGEKMVVVFQTGMLAGQEYDLEQTDEVVTGYVHVDATDPAKNRRFKLVSQMVDGFAMPGGNFIPRVGDRYAVFGMAMPAEYVRDDASKSGASWDMFREAVRNKYENEEQRFLYECQLDPLYAQANWDDLEDRIVPGGYVEFSDQQFQPEGVLIRISAQKEYLHQEKKPELDLTNVVIGGGVRGEIAKIDQQEVVIDERIRGVAALTKRRFRDTEEHLGLIEQAVQGYEKGINPAWVKTMAILLGDASLQFQFIARLGSMDAIGSGIQYDPATKKLTAPAGIIQHQTLRITTLAPNHEAKEYMHWTLPAFESEVLYEAVPLYVYAKCHKDTSANGYYFVGMGEIFLSEETHDFDNTDGNYYLLIGTLSSGYDGDRSYMESYGFAEMSPSQFIVNLIRSVDGKTFFNLRDSIIGGNIHFTATDGTSKSVAEYADETNAITDNFTKIAGGLILTTLIKMMSGDTETGGLSANLDNILLWGGGTYEQALQNLAKTILRHDGSGQFAAGNFAWDTQGNIILKSNSSGVSVVIDPVGRRLYMTNSDGEIVGEWSFESEYGSTIEITDGRAPASNISVSGRGFNSANQYGRVFLGDNQIWLVDTTGDKEIFLQCSSNRSAIQAILKGLPTNANGLNTGEVWRDSSGYLRIAP